MTAKKLCTLNCLCPSGLSLIKRCLTRYSGVVRYVTSYGLQYSRMSSTLGKKYTGLHCSEQFLWSQSDLLGETFDKKTLLCSLSKQKGCWIVLSCYMRAWVAMVKCNILYIPDNFLNHTSKDINDMLYNLCTSWC